MENQYLGEPLSDYFTLRDVARRLGASYYAAYSLAVSGQLGTPLIFGRLHLYRRTAAADEAIRACRAKLAGRGQTAPTGTTEKES